jgi:FdhD protein
MREIQVSRVNVAEKTIQQKTDYVAEEKPLHIFLNKRHYGTILCSPSQQKEMVIGHLLSEGVLQSIGEIHAMHLKKDGKCLLTLKPDIEAETRISTSNRFSRLIVSACGSPTYRSLSEIMEEMSKLESTLKVDANIVFQSVQSLNTIAENFRRTGGVHVAAIYDKEGKLQALAEDVGRHNAVDKVIGAAAIQNMDFNSLFLTLSGRLTGDLVVKAARLKIQIVGSLSAAISSGLDTAELTNITLVGFVRGKRMNVYTAKERIVFQ